MSSISRPINRSERRPSWLIGGRSLTALASGAITAFAFPPFDLSALALAGPLAAFWLWERSSPRTAFLYGSLYTIGLLVIGGYWLYLTPQQLSDSGVILGAFLTTAFIIVMSLYMGAAGFLYVLLRNQVTRLGRCLFLFPAVWVLAEWWRGWFMTGFPWFSLGYSQIDTPLSGWAPVFGSYGLSLALALTAGVIVSAITFSSGERLLGFVTLMLLWGCGYALDQIRWTVPEGSPLAIALVQPQKVLTALESDSERWRTIVDTTDELLAEHDLVIWPETIETVYMVAIDSETPTAFKVDDRELDKTLWRKRVFSLDGDSRDFAVAFHHEDMILEPLERMARRRGKAVMIGLRLRDTKRDLDHNSLLVLGGQGRTIYDKRHLVPFGEFIPLRDTLSPIWDWLDVHDSLFAGSRTASNVVQAAGHRIGVSICYESGFANEIAEALPEAQFLVMLSSDQKYQNTSELPQHQQIARMRALETGRWIARATTTGQTAFLSPKGEIVAPLPVDAYGVSGASVAAMTGMTPFATWGHRPVVALIATALAWPLLAAGLGKRRLPDRTNPNQT